jgi:opacity protein-like surface antigen
MRKLFTATLFIACAAPFAFAQAGDDYNKYDIGVLYSHNRVDTGIEDPNQNFLEEREGFHGIEVFVKGNLSRYVGLVGSYSYVRKSFELNGGPAAPTFDVDADLQQLLGGVELKDNAKETKVKPFGRVLVGYGHPHASLTSPVVSFEESSNAFSAAVGGGVDFRLSDRVDFRAVQFEWSPVRAHGDTSQNFRFGIGLIFR